MTSYVFTHATVLDGTEGMEPQPNMTVVVNEGIIEKVGPAATTVGPFDAREIDLAGAYLAPGLVNLHVHLCGSGKPTSAGAAGDLIDKVVGNPLGRWYLRRTLKAHVRQQLASGVTTVRSVGDPGFADVDVRDAIDAGRYPGPRLVASGVGVTVPGGHGAGLFAHVASTPEEARAIVRDCFAHKCDLVKLFITGGVFDAEVEGEPGVLRMSPEVAQAACDEARKLGLRTAAHIESAEGVRAGLEAGVDTIEHGAALDDELIALFKRNGAGRASSLTCTVSPALPFVELDPAKTHSTEVQKVNGRIVFEGIVQAAKQALAAGIPVGLEPIRRAPTSPSTTCGARWCTSSASWARRVRWRCIRPRWATRASWGWATRRAPSRRARRPTSSCSTATPWRTWRRFATCAWSWLAACWTSILA